MKTLIEVCQRIGRKVPQWTQGQGGNVSVKHGGFLWIKASGMRLDEVRSDRGLAKLEIDSLIADLRGIGKDDPDGEVRYSEIIGKRSLQEVHLGRASMETGFHALLPGKWVIHFHSLASLIVSFERQRSKAKMTEWLSDVVPEAVFMSSVRPGLKLSNALLESAPSWVYFLENHGVVLQGETEEVLERWERLESRFLADWSVDLSSLTEGGQASGPLKVYFPDTAVFLDRLRKCLVSAGGNSFRFSPELIPTHKDLAEIWWATALLYGACPELPELATEISSSLAGLPTEQFRRNLTHV